MSIMHHTETVKFRRITDMVIRVNDQPDTNPNPNTSQGINNQQLNQNERDYKEQRMTLRKRIG